MQAAGKLQEICARTDLGGESNKVRQWSKVSLCEQAAVVLDSACLVVDQK